MTSNPKLYELCFFSLKRSTTVTLPGVLITADSDPLLQGNENVVKSLAQYFCTQMIADFSYFAIKKSCWFTFFLFISAGEADEDKSSKFS
jgi:hypothetical protein